MKIVALVTDAFGGRGGIAQYNRDFLEALATLRNDAKIIVFPRHAPDRFSAPSNVIQRKPSAGRLAFAAGAVLASLRERVHLVFCGHLFLAPLAVLIARLKGAKLIVQTHGIEAWPRPTAMQRIAVEGADLVLCVSRFTRSRVGAWAALEPARLMVVPDTVAEDCIPGDGGQFRSRWDLRDRRMLLTVGRLDRREAYKGHDRVIAVLPRLIAAGHDVAYVIVGEGDRRPQLEELAQAHGVTDRVVFTGALSRESVIDAYCAADLFVMPSTGEGFGIVFLEAMACGTPALGLAVAGALDPLADGALGAAVAEADIVPAIARSLSGPRPDRKELAAAVGARFGREAFRSRVRLALERVMQSG